MNFGLLCCGCTQGAVIPRWKNISLVRPEADTSPQNPANLVAPYQRYNVDTFANYPPGGICGGADGHTCATDFSPGSGSTRNGHCGTWLVGPGDLNTLPEQEIQDLVSDIIACATKDSTHQYSDHDCYQAYPTVTAGSFIVSATYQIISIGTTDFTAIGASANTVGLTFTATGAGTGTGTAQLVVDMRTGQPFGGKWILARKFWHGCFGWLSNDDPCATHNPNLAPDQVKYLTITSLDVHLDWTDGGGGTIVNHYVADSSGAISVGRLTGIVSSNLSTTETDTKLEPVSGIFMYTDGGAGYTQNPDGSNHVAFGSGGVTLIDGIAVEDVHCNQVALPPAVDTMLTNYIGAASVTIDGVITNWNSTFPAHPLPAVTNVNAYNSTVSFLDSGTGYNWSVTLAWNRSATTYSWTFLFSWQPHTGNFQQNVVFTGSLVLSNPYTSADACASVFPVA